MQAAILAHGVTQSQSFIGGNKSADLLITSGGTSVGDFDHVKDVVGATGELSFWRVRVRPGKPLLFGAVGDLSVMGFVCPRLVYGSICVTGRWTGSGTAHN